MESSATVAVLFCDVVGSTARQVRLGDEVADDHRRRLFARLDVAVSSSGGSVVKTLGDGLMAVFQHSTVESLTCAIRMHEIAASFDPSDPLELRIGISAGEVLEEDGDYFGTPVVEAARLCDAASARRTLAHAIVASLVGSRASRFRLTDGGTVSLKGLAGPTPVVDVDERDPDEHRVGKVAAAVRAPDGPVDGRLDEPDPQPVPVGASPLAGPPSGDRGSGHRGRRRVAVVGGALVLASLAMFAVWAGSTGGDDTGEANGGDPEEVASQPTSDHVPSELGYEPVLATLDCPSNVLQNLPDARCGLLEVPENRQRLEGRTLSIPVTMVPARTATDADPVVVVDFGEHLNRSELIEVADTWSLGIRGFDDEGASDLACPELTEAWRAALTLPADDPGATVALSGAAGECSARLGEEGIDLNGYTWREVAADIRDLVIAADLGRATVAGGSYTALSAGFFARSNPSMVNALLLVNPVAPGESPIAVATRTTTLAVSHLNDLCRSDPQCSSSMGDLAPLVRERVRDAGAEPRVVSVESLDGDGPFEVLLDDLRVGAALETSMRATEQLGLIPWSIRGASDELLAAVALHDVATAYLREEAKAGATLSYGCSYEAQATAVAEVYSGPNSDFAGAQDFHFPAMCSAWGVESRGVDFSDPLPADVPVLVVDGAMSESGVNGWADEVVEPVDSAVVVRFDTMSGDVVFDPPACLREIRKQFAVDPSSVTDVAQCESESPAIEWVTD